MEYNLGDISLLNDKPSRSNTDYRHFAKLWTLAAILGDIMYWEEKIDDIKRKFSQTDFRVPFSDWPKIFKKIEAKFVKRRDSSYHFTNWAGNLKGQAPIHTISEQSLSNEIGKLDPVQNYWLVILTGNEPTARYLIYDCKPKSLNAVLSIAPGHFCIVNKKLEWLTYFEVDKENKEVTLSKCGDARTPFESIS